MGLGVILRVRKQDNRKIRRSLSGQGEGDEEDGKYEDPAHFGALKAVLLTVNAK